MVECHCVSAGYDGSLLFTQCSSLPKFNISARWDKGVATWGVQHAGMGCFQQALAGGICQHIVWHCLPGGVTLLINIVNHYPKPQRGQYYNGRLYLQNLSKIWCHPHEPMVCCWGLAAVVVQLLEPLSAFFLWGL